MLKNLHIANYALIEKLDIDFSEGFSVITGETGAGKSIILGALGLLLGARADTKSIKTGATKCCIEGTFDVRGLELEDYFETNDIDFDGEECIIRREVTSTGKSRAFVNDTPVSLAKVKNICQSVIDIHSQHQNLLMGNETFLTDTLDTIAGNDKQLSEYHTTYDQWSAARRELEDLKRQADKDKADTDYLQFQWQQLADANLQDEDEQELLEQEADTLSHAEEIKSALYQCVETLGGGESGQNIGSLLKTSAQSLTAICGVFKPAEPLAERIDSARIELEDIASELEHALEHVDFDPERLAYVDERLSLIYELEKKHRVENIAQLKSLSGKLQEQLERVSNIDSIIEKKELELDILRKQMEACAQTLTESRQKAADKTVIALGQTIKSMGMPNARLQFSFRQRPQPDRSGCDNITFLFSANKNIPEQNVADIASGGEIARLMLALKALISGSRNLPTVIFDEIDTGVSGTMAEKMANVMLQMAQNCQVICITHLPQIAARGHQHYRVYKEESENGTASHIVRLSDEERISEIANMLSGVKMTQAAIDNARALLHYQEKA